MTRSRHWTPIILSLLVVAAASAVVKDAPETGPEPPWLAGRELEPTWAGGVGLVFEHRCMSCHRQGGVAPMSFTTYGETRRWTKNMRVQVTTRAMPPWPAAPEIGHFRNSLALTARELDLFESWAAAGFPKGNGDHEPQIDLDREWTIGQPDAVFELPEVTVDAATGAVMKELWVETDFPEDRFIVASEVKPGDEYSVLYVDGGALGSFYSGNSNETLPPGTGYLLPAGARVPVRIHYRKETGYAITDRTRLAVRFAEVPSSIERQIRCRPLANREFVIPPGASDHTVTARLTIDEEVQIASLLPVMLERGKSIRYDLTLPDGHQQALLEIAAWDPLWNYRYQLAEPILAPPGAVLTATAVYDNSAANLRNPDPGAAVGAGIDGELLEGWIGLAGPVAADVRERFDRQEPGPTPKQLVEYRLVHEERNGSADSAISPDGTWFSFASRRSGNLDIWKVHTETGELRRVTDHPSSDYEARWHPDGTEIAFVTHRGGSQDVYIKDLETGEETPVATESFNEDYPSYSKDGSEIVFTGGPGGYREVQVYNRESGETRTLTKGYGWVGSTNFSPDGRSIVFHAYYEKSYLSGKSDLFVVPAHGGEVRNLTKSSEVWDYKATWSYDGEWIAFSSKRSSPNFNLFLIRPDGSDLRQLTEADESFDLRWVNWTRDGRLGWHQIEPQEGRIKAVDTTSGEVREILASEDYVSHLGRSPGGERMVYESNGKLFLLATALGAEAEELGRGLEPRWSSDGKRITFLATRRGENYTPEWGFGTIAVEGGEPSTMTWISPLTIAERPDPWNEGAFDEAWSPDGSQLAKVVRGKDREDLILIAQDGSSRELTGDGLAKSSPIWSPDGKLVFYVENRPRTVGYYLTTGPVGAR